jgi:colanic acid/amylovoran biosynthesis glycosyltransferase
MKILMYADGFGVGTQTFIRQDAEYLSKTHELLFLCTQLNGPDTASFSKFDVTVLPFKHSFLQRKLWQYDLFLSYRNRNFKKELNRIIEHFKPDLIHCQFGIESLKLIDNLEAQDIPLVIQFRGYDASRMLNKKSYVKRLKEVLGEKYRYAIFVAQSLKNNLQQHGIDTGNSMILHSGIDLSRFSRKQERENDTFTFLQISSLNQKKGHEYTLEAFAKFLFAEKSRNYRLILTGDGERKAGLIALRDRLGLEAYVDFIGFVTPEEAKVLLENADAFVHHSITPEDGDEEGIPNALIEAMAMELPVISTYHAGIPELVEDGVNGYLVEEKDIDTYAARMADITSWGKLKINRETVAQEFEINKHIAKLEAFYQKMLSESPL